MRLQQFVKHFVKGLIDADRQGPIPRLSRTNRQYGAGIGSHNENDIVRLALERAAPYLGNERAHTHVRYPGTRKKCDIFLQGPTSWAIEVKLLRRLGDNGKPNDNIFMHLLSPYPRNQSAVTDCVKLATSYFQSRKAVMIIGFEYPDWPLEPAIDAFERIASHFVSLGPRISIDFDNLVHPTQVRGTVFAWEVL